jgi:ferritin-like metal-binding protein YciE
MFHHDVFIAHRNNLAVILTHLDETKTHVQRVEQVFQMHGAEAKAIDCPAIDGIIKEADEIVGEVADKAVLDAALINAAQAAEHYEIALRQLDRVGEAAWPQRLRQRLAEDARGRKGTLAESKINLRAAS